MTLPVFLTVVLFLVLVLILVRYVVPLVKNNPDKKEIARLKNETEVFREIAKTVGRIK